MPWQDEWPVGPDGKQYDGKQLMTLIRNDNSPFRSVWDVKLLIEEIEITFRTEVTDIPMVNAGFCNYGFHLKTSNQGDLVARLGRDDVNMPGFDGVPVRKQAAAAQFEAAVYHLLSREPDIRASYLIHHRVPIEGLGPRLTNPLDLSGRRLFVFKRAIGSNNAWVGLGAKSKLYVLDQLAHMRAALFHYNLPLAFAAQYLHERIFDFKPESFDMPVAPTREFWMHVLECKIRATIRDKGDRIGWAENQETVGPIALAAKQCLLRAIPYIMPIEATQVYLYRLVLEHGDFGISNISITAPGDQMPRVTSLYDWENACIVPAVLSDPLLTVSPVELMAGIDGSPCVDRIPRMSSTADLNKYAVWARHYIKQLYSEAPDYEGIISVGKDVRQLWFALRDWGGGDSESYFGDLMLWAEQRIKECGGS